MKGGWVGGEQGEGEWNGWEREQGEGGVSVGKRWYFWTFERKRKGRCDTGRPRLTPLRCADLSNDMMEAPDAPSAGSGSMADTVASSLASPLTDSVAGSFAGSAASSYMGEGSFGFEMPSETTLNLMLALSYATVFFGMFVLFRSIHHYGAVRRARAQIISEAVVAELVMA